MITFFFFTFQHRTSFVLTFPGRLYILAKHTHTDYRGSKCCSMRCEVGYIDEARELLFSLLISLNLLIPILKPVTMQCFHLLCGAPRQIKLSFILLPFKHNCIQWSSISSAILLCVSVALIYSQTLCVNLVTFNTAVTYCYTHYNNKTLSPHCFRAFRSWQWRYQPQCTGLKPI